MEHIIKEAFHVEAIGMNKLEIWRPWF